MKLYQIPGCRFHARLYVHIYVCLCENFNFKLSNFILFTTNYFTPFLKMIQYFVIYFILL